MTLVVDPAEISARLQQLEAEKKTRDLVPLFWGIYKAPVFDT